MLEEQREFIEGFMAATRIIRTQTLFENPMEAGSSLEKRKPLPAASPITREKLYLSLEDYLAIPTFIRQGKRFRIFE